MISTETGKPIAQAEREWALACDQFRWYAEEARRIYGRIVESRVPGGRFEVTREPVGIVAAFTAWNFPAALVARKWPRRSPRAVGDRPAVGPDAGHGDGDDRLLPRGNLPDGVVNLVVGPTSATYAPIMASPLVRKVSLTGSTRVGQQMIRDAAETMKKVTMELGGNAPLIVYDDADLEAALNASVPTKFANAGQVCVTADRFFIHESLHDAFVEGFAGRAKALKLGDGLDPSVQMGPVINGRRRGELEDVVADAVKAGARLVAGGGRAGAFNAGFFLEPTVLADVTDEMKVFAEENFGPIAAITRFRDEDEVVARANAGDMGLSAYAFTRSPDRARRTVAGAQSRDGRDQQLRHGCLRGAVRRNPLLGDGPRRRLGGRRRLPRHQARPGRVRGRASVHSLSGTYRGGVGPRCPCHQGSLLMPHVLVAGKLHPSGIALLKSRSDVTFDYVEEVSEPSYAPLIGSADGLVIRTQPLSADTVRKADRLRIVSRHGVGYDGGRPRLAE